MLVDTNILLRAARAGFAWAAQLEEAAPGARVIVPHVVREELESLEATGISEATVARALAAQYPDAESPGRGDDAILALAVALRALILTADRQLQARARAAGLDVLVPRDRDRLTRLAGRARAARRSGKIMKRPRLVRPSSGR